MPDFKKENTIDSHNNMVEYHKKYAEWKKVWKEYRRYDSTFYKIIENLGNFL